jgi:hypothetical protein
MAGGDRTTVSSGKQLRRSAGAVPSGAQIRAARALLSWTVRDLARRAVVSITAVNLIAAPEEAVVRFFAGARRAEPG